MQWPRETKKKSAKTPVASNDDMIHQDRIER